MNTDFTIKNFRIFDREGATIDLRPITILTGCNNSGKSSIVKALCLLKDFCRNIEADYANKKQINLSNYKLDFHKKPNDILGGFSNVLYNEAKIKKQEKEVGEILHDEKQPIATEAIDSFTFETIVESHFLLQHVKVALTFKARQKDALDDAKLTECTISTLDGKCIYHGTSEPSDDEKVDFTSVKQNLLRFLYFQRAMANWQYECELAAFEQCKPHEQIGKQLDKQINQFLDRRDYQGLIDCFEYHTSNAFRYEVHPYNSSDLRALLKEQKLTDDFAKSAELNVGMYYPFMYDLRDLPKKEIRPMIENKIKTNGTALTEFQSKILTLFFADFEGSEFASIHEYMAEKENLYFQTMSDWFWGKGRWSNYYISCDVESEDVNYLPEKADWGVILVALDFINQQLTGTEDTLWVYDVIKEVDRHFLENDLVHSISLAVEDILHRILPGDIIYTGTSIVEQKRLYALENGTEFSEALRRYFEAVRKLESQPELDKYNKGIAGIDESEERYVKNAFLNKWLENLGIAHHAEVAMVAEGYGMTIRLFNNADDKEGVMLCDKGYGVTQLFAMLLKIETAIIEMEEQSHRCLYSFRNLYSNMAKIVPPYRAANPITVAIEEPENHLHPALQSKLADMIADASNNYGVHFLIESHSEYFIRRLQVLVKEQTLNSNHVSLLYVNSADKPVYEPLVIDIGLNENGTLKNTFGSGFFDEATQLTRELIKDDKK